MFCLLFTFLICTLCVPEDDPGPDHHTEDDDVVAPGLPAEVHLTKDVGIVTTLHPNLGVDLHLHPGTETHASVDHVVEVHELSSQIYVYELLL